MQDPSPLPEPKATGLEPIRGFKKSVRFSDIYGVDPVVRKEVRIRNRERERAAPTSPPAGPEWFYEEFRRLFTEMERRMQGEGATPAEPAQEPVRGRKFRVRPAAHDAGVVAAKPMELFAPEFKKGRLCFSCPVCHHIALLPMWFAGKKSICPRCYSAIRAPHPRRKLRPLNLQNTSEALLHPERFLDCRNAHRFILGVPRPNWNGAFHFAAVLVIICLLATLPGMMHMGERLQQASMKTSEAAAASPAGLGWAFQDRARRTVEQFLAAGSPVTRAAMVKDAARVTPLMERYYGEKEQPLKLGADKMEVSATGFPAADGAPPFTNVEAQLPGGRNVVFTVEHTATGDLIDWESSVGYSPDDVRAAVTTADGQPKTIRVLASIDDYYNFSYSDNSRWICLRLEDQASGELLGYGYMDQNGNLAGDVLDVLASTNGEPAALVVTIKCAAQNAGSPQMEITQFLPPGTDGHLAESTPGH